ncbi:CaiB/BaiF CoA-transferase family protein [Neobacillus sp. OS1-32]|uniref:CoA transferase n=1 Tax=Neobacillus paridis TaxID=2803862 RepID=A0ABS1TK50_9BACI|nr:MULTISPECIES: CaiB/BaiF CoA-transferase family protein [Neobacillus]MBL4950893.1 CoA transferase [Neobacillus paridis]WML31122.1 CaiB/BaiF CoA-transferase family protein [Neobacillus sp. OS1-32]
MMGALTGLKVLDLTRVLAGPYCTMILADLGADVIKVEAPGGSDETRAWGPPFQNGVSAYYLCANRNKRSITVNLKTEEGREIIRTLAKEADVLIHNFKTGSMENWSLDYDSLKHMNPRLVYCSITGFGETGPYRHLPGYDYIIQGMSGLMSITGSEESGPMKIGVAMVDILTGLYSAISIEAALLEREKSGEGQKIDMSLMDTAVSSLANVASNYLMSGTIPRRLGNDHPNIVPYSKFKARDGEMIIAVGNNRQFATLCEVMGISEIAADERFHTNEARVKNKQELTDILESRLQGKPIQEWLELFSQHNIPCGPIATMDQVFNHPQVIARDMVAHMDHPEAGEIKLVGSPIKLSRTKTKIERHPPIAGEHTAEILQQAGYSQEEIEHLKEKNIIQIYQEAFSL